MKKTHSENNKPNKHNKLNKPNKTVQSNNNNNNIVIGKISASWCGHCVALQPIWDKVLKNPGNSFVNFLNIEKEKDAEAVEIIRINSELLPNSEEKLESNGYPTIFKIDNGILEYYKEDRDEPTINNWIQKSTPKPHKHKVSNNYRHTTHYKSRVVHTPIANNRTKRISGGKKRNKKHNRKSRNK
jgi:thiol-disulfide isomerase/thioredoxin